MNKLFGILLAGLLLVMPLMGCTATDPITDDIYIEGGLYLWDGDSWEAVTTEPGGAHTLDGGQSDVTIAGVANNEVLAYDTGTTEWINQTPSEAGLTANADFNAKGDLLTATADDTPSIQGVGGDGEVLTADSGEADGIKWAVPAGGGVSYTELAGTVTTASNGWGVGDGAWYDWDLSGTLPEGTETAEIHVVKNGASDSIGVRADGSALARSGTVLKAQIYTVMVEVESTRIIELMSGDVSDADVFSLWGYWD